MDQYITLEQADQDLNGNKREGGEKESYIKWL